MMKISWKINSLLLLALMGLPLEGQVTDSVWTLPKCIDYAMQKNISIQQKALTNETNRINANQAKAMRIPSLNAAVSQNFQWSRSFDNANSTYGKYSSSDGTNYSLNSSLRLFNGFKTTNDIKQAELNYQAGNYDVETLKEAISLNVLDAYLQVLYSEEQVKNSEKQIESTSHQLTLSEERLKLGSISRADYLQVNSQLATEKLTLANAQNQLAVNRVSLMQLMELPVSSSFAIEHPDMEISEAFNAE
ncbi:MAG TPA: TolC family protein, partial [Bacteroidales bacterium]